MLQRNINAITVRQCTYKSHGDSRPCLSEENRRPASSYTGRSAKMSNTLDFNSDRAALDIRKQAPMNIGLQLVFPVRFQHFQRGIPSSLARLLMQRHAWNNLKVQNNRGVLKQKSLHSFIHSFKTIFTITHSFPAVKRFHERSFKRLRRETAAKRRALLSN